MRLWALIRILVGLLFVVAGLAKFPSDTWLHLFERWHVPLPSISVYLVGGFEIVGGMLLALGLGATLVAVLFVFEMIGAIGFAGTRDGLPFIIEPLVLGILCGLFALRGAGAWQLRPLPTAQLMVSGLRRRA